RLVVLEHAPHGFDVFGRVAPVAFGGEIAEIQLGLLAGEDGCDAAGDFAGDEGFAAAGGFVVEEDAVGGEEVVGVAVESGHLMGEDFGDGVGRLGREGGGFALGGFGDAAEHFG